MRRFLFLAALVAALHSPPPSPGTRLVDNSLNRLPRESTGGMTVTVGSVRLTARLVATADVTVTCQPKPPDEYPISSYWEDYAMTFSVKQASRRSIAFGQAAVPFDPNVICDGLPHTLSASVSADPAGVAFKNVARWSPSTVSPGPSPTTRRPANPDTTWVAHRPAGSTCGSAAKSAQRSSPRRRLR